MITPRFAPTCSVPLLRGLGELAAEYHVPIQSHLCEQESEIAFTKTLFPQYHTTAEIFHEAGLLTNQVSVKFTVGIPVQETLTYH